MCYFLFLPLTLGLSWILGVLLAAALGILAGAWMTTGKMLSSEEETP
jgi:cyd operon protein YbgT